MFTGLVEDLGTITAITPCGDGLNLTITTVLAERLNVGDSLAINGICLTVTEKNARRVAVTAVAETLRRTTLGKAQSGQRCNLESAVRAGQALGGHVVQGHVDGLGRVLERTRLETGEIFAVEIPESLERYVVEKGSIALDGVSLTVAAVAGNTVRIALIPHTLAQTTLGSIAVGDSVNVEVDILAKYLEKWAAPYLAAGTTTKSSSLISADWLRDKGFA